MTGKIKLNATSGGGSVSFQAPSSTGDDRIITLPTTADGTVLTTTNPKSGSIIQVIQTKKTNVFTWTSNGNTEITGMGVTITPSSSSNKVLIQCEIGACGMYNSGFPLFFVLYRGSSMISGAVGDELSNGQQSCTTYHKFENYWEGGSTSFAYLDEPSTTSATTYKLYSQRHTDGGTGYFNTTARQINNRYAKSLSTITAMEVAG